MNDLTEQGVLTQLQVIELQKHISAGALPAVPLKYNHYFAEGIYGRLMSVPAGTIVVGKPHRTQHLCILLKGRLAVTRDDGTVVEMAAPAVYVAEAGQKKAALVLEDLEFMNIHPVQTQDLDEIEKQVIIPEEEFEQAVLAGAKVLDKIKGETV